MFCKYCGQEIKNDAQFCPYCGGKQGHEVAEPIARKASPGPGQMTEVIDFGEEQFEEDEYPPYDTVTVVKPGGRGIGKIIAIIVAVLVVIAVAAGVIWFLTGDKDKTDAEKEKTTVTTNNEAQSETGSDNNAEESDGAVDFSNEESSTEEDESLDKSNDSVDDMDYPGDSIIFPDSSYRLIEKSEYENLSEDALHDAVNEIYARHGYNFGGKAKYLEKYQDCDWYNPSSKTMDQVNAEFNDIEQANVDNLAHYNKKIYG